MKHIITILLGLIIFIGLVQALIQHTDDPASFVELSQGKIAYDKYGNGSKAIIMVHGSPGTSEKDFSLLGPNITSDYTVYALNMYGFAGSKTYVKDYSISAGADVVREFMDTKNISQAVILGYSWGGGVAIESAYRYPSRIKGIILLGGMGIQEGEITGTYWGEKIRSYVALPFVLFYPGAFDGSFESRYGFMRSFIDSDQRPLRQMLNEIDQPALVLQGQNDFIIAPWVGEEHARLIENSALVYYEGDHHTVYSNVSEIAPPINEFLDYLDTSQAHAKINLFVEGGSQ